MIRTKHLNISKIGFAIISVLVFVFYTASSSEIIDSTNIDSNNSIIEYSEDSNLIYENVKPIIEYFENQDTSYVRKLYNQGYHNRLSHDPDSMLIALNDLMTIISLDEHFIDAYNQIGLIYSELKQPDSAIKYLNISIKLDPDDSQAYRCLGYVYDKMCNIEKAIEYYKESIKRDPDERHTYLRLADDYNRICDYKNEVETLKKAISIKNNIYPPDYFDRGMAYEKLWDFDNAIKYYRKAYELDTNRYFVKHTLDEAESSQKEKLNHTIYNRPSIYQDIIGIRPPKRFKINKLYGWSHPVGVVIQYLRGSENYITYLLKFKQEDDWVNLEIIDTIYLYSPFAECDSNTIAYYTSIDSCIHFIALNINENIEKKVDVPICQLLDDSATFYPISPTYLKEDSILVTIEYGDKPSTKICRIINNISIEIENIIENAHAIYLLKDSTELYLEIYDTINSSNRNTKIGIYDFITDSVWIPNIQNKVTYFPYRQNRNSPLYFMVFDQINSVNIWRIENGDKNLKQMTNFPYSIWINNYEITEDSLICDISNNKFDPKLKRVAISTK